MKLNLVKLGILISLISAFAGCGKRTANEPTPPKLPIKEALLKERSILLGSPISDQEAADVIAKLKLFQSQSKRDPIKLYINSPGGSVTAGLTIVETMQDLETPVHTICLGQARSMAAIILLAGSRGNRGALPTATISFHEVEAGGVITPEKRKQLDKLTAALIDKVVQMTGMTKEKVSLFFVSQRSFQATEACSLGIIDFVVERSR
jgi:ATP-dependent Clp protease, protease subunit